MICFSGIKPNKDGALPSTKEDYAKRFNGNVNFNYSLLSAQTVERNNYGEELREESTVDSYVTMSVQREKLLTSWTKDATVNRPRMQLPPFANFRFSNTCSDTTKIRRATSF